MSDKPLVQQGLATELAELILTIATTSASLAFLRGFWETTVREWNGIDRLRYVVPTRKLCPIYPALGSTSITCSSDDL